MKITSLRFTQKSNLGNYEAMEATIEASFDDDDNVAEEANKLRMFVDWHANAIVRDRKKDKFERELNTDIDDTRRAKIEQWLNTYEVTKAEVESL